MRNGLFHIAVLAVSGTRKQKNRERFHAPTGATGVTLEGDYGSRTKTSGPVQDHSKKVPTGVQLLSIVTKVINVSNLVSLTMLKPSILLNEICSRRSSVISLLVLWESPTALKNVRRRQILNNGRRSAILLGDSFSFILGPLDELRRIIAWKLVF